MSCRVPPVVVTDHGDLSLYEGYQENASQKHLNNGDGGWQGVITINITCVLSLQTNFKFVQNMHLGMP